MIYSRTPTNSTAEWTSTDEYVNLWRRRAVMLARIDGSEGQWKKHWQAELSAIQRQIWALGGDNAPVVDIVTGKLKFGPAEEVA